MLQPGDKAPDFALRATDKSLIKLSEQRGKNVVILFFPFAFTGVCTKELCYMRDSLAQYEKLNAQILAISKIEIKKAVDAYRLEQREAVITDAKKLQGNA